FSLAGEELLVLSGHEALVSLIDLGDAGQPIATASYDGTLRLWDPHDGSCRAVLHGNAGEIRGLTRSSTGILMTGHDDGTARLWPDTNVASAIVLAGHNRPVWSVAFDSTGARAVTGSLDGSARVWDTRDGSVLAVLTGHAEGVWNAQFIDADRVLTVSNDRTVRVWSLTGGDPPLVLTGHSDPITDVAVSSTGRFFVTASADRSAKIWRLDRLTSDSDRLAAALDRATIHCLDVEQRVRELGEAPNEAAAAFSECEHHHGRMPAGK
ncbi:MAG TPA: WD40 repeat domain-containing protein, partial [Enhygromyxa sp.]|nr:WD40 repeat domain-containing protein [Enhygromyxa sp.]